MAIFTEQGRKLLPLWKLVVNLFETFVLNSELIQLEGHVTRCDWILPKIQAEKEAWIFVLLKWILLTFYRSCVFLSASSSIECWRSV